MRRTRKPINQINVVPYIDVMLVLLVIFMVTAPLVAPGEIQLPSVGSKLTPAINAVCVGDPDKSITVLIDESASTRTQVKIDARFVRRAGAGDPGGPDQPVVIDADKGSRYEDVIGVLDRLHWAASSAWGCWRDHAVLTLEHARLTSDRPGARAGRPWQMDGADAGAVRQPAVHRRAGVLGVVAEPQA